MTIALDRPVTLTPSHRTPSRAAASRAGSLTGTALTSLAPFTAPGPRVPRPAAEARTVSITLTIDLPAGTPDVESARLADALRQQAQRLTAGRRARASVDVSSPHPFTAAGPRSSRTLGPAATATAPAAPASTRRPGVVSPSSPARRDVEIARRRALAATAVSPSAAPGPTTALVIDLYGRRVRLDGTDIELTYKEFELLAHLAGRARSIVSRDELMATVWADAEGDTGERTVDVHIRRVRTKLGRYRRLISTVRGAGYRLDPGSDVAIIG